MRKSIGCRWPLCSHVTCGSTRNACTGGSPVLADFAAKRSVEGHSEAQSSENRSESAHTGGWNESRGSVLKLSAVFLHRRKSLCVGFGVMVPDRRDRCTHCHLPCSPRRIGDMPLPMRRSQLGSVESPAGTTVRDEAAWARGRSCWPGLQPWSKRLDLVGPGSRTSGFVVGSNYWRMVVGMEMTLRRWTKSVNVVGERWVMAICCGGRKGWLSATGFGRRTGLCPSTDETLAVACGSL